MTCKDNCLHYEVCSQFTKKQFNALSEDNISKIINAPESEAEFNALMGVISSMPTEQADKFKGAVKKLCGAIVSRCE